MSEKCLYQGPIYVKKSPVHGYGVFAAADLAAQELIEECHTLPYSEHVGDLADYAFSWQPEHRALPLGFACIYNHSTTPNVQYETDLKRGLITFKTLRAIRKGEELFSSYGKHWFERRKLKPKKLGLWYRAFRNSGLLLRAALIIAVVFTCIHGLRYLSS